MPTEISRSKIDLYLECKRCFYLYAKHRVRRPGGFPFTLNNAVDLLLKKEFDHYRGLGQPHPLMTAAGIDAIPAQNAQMDRWRHNFTGVSYNDAVRDFRVFGAIDDLWLGKDGQHLVVDYKATAKAAPVVALDQEWHAGYKRQMEVYQWLLRQNGLDVSDTAYFVYCTGDNTKAAFDAHLDFTINVIPYHGDASWVDGVLDEIKACLDRTATPDPSESCDYCNYREKVGEYLE
jgi:CRISPR/Cas system-associated exonuclease Cas4 (RecB family)